MITTAHLAKRAKAGDASALFRLGYRLAYGRNRRRPTQWRKVFSLWKKAAEQWHTRAMFYLGVCYDDGLGTTQDVEKAMFWYEAAARAGHSEAQYNLSLGYRDGDGVPKRADKRIHWLTESAKAGLPSAMQDRGLAAIIPIVVAHH